MTTVNRWEAIDALKHNPSVSVLIIGAGVNGVGVFRDLAIQGVDVLLVDKGDFCSGTSASSSHMVHGGIRYLENGEFRLVREAACERNLLIENAPHYVRPLPTTIPVFRWASGFLNAPLKFLRLLDKPAERGALIIKIGLWLYDKYNCSSGILPRHQFSSRRQSIAETPLINSDILCTATYYDGSMRAPERICIEMIIDAEEITPHAHAINYLSARRTSCGRMTLVDELTGDVVTVHPRIVVNAAGPWIDFVNDALDVETNFIGGTKGSHIVLDHPELRDAIGEREFFFENDDGRIVLIFPLQDKVMIGTSDLRCDQPDGARCSEEEIDYFFRMIGKVFPTIRVARSQIIFRFSGVRPLAMRDDGNTGYISRDHELKVVTPSNGREFPVYCMIGGKWTTFRAFSEQVTDMVLKYLSVPRERSTRNLAIGGGTNYPRTRSEQRDWIRGVWDKTNVPLQRIETLFERYGTRADQVTAFIASQTDQPLSCHSDYSEGEIAFLALREKVTHLDDLVLRRSELALLGELSAGLIAELAEVVGDVLDWSTSKRQSEVKRTCDLLSDRHEVEL